MRTLYHLWLSPRCRIVRIVLGEKGLDYETEIEKVWERRETFLAMNPAGDLPVLVEPSGDVLSDWSAICHYLDEVYPRPSIFGAEPVVRAEVRRLAAWFDEKFTAEVTNNLVGEKIMKRLLGHGTPNSAAIRAGKANIRTHLHYISWLSDRRNWLAGNDLSLADIAAGAQISCIDYIGDVPWEAFPKARAWYARLKSRPSLRPILQDHLPGIPPPDHYADPDF